MQDESGSGKGTGQAEEAGGKKLDETGPDEPSKGESKDTEKKELAEDDPANAETTILH